MKEMDRLVALLFPQENGGSRILDLKFFPGEQPVTVEDFCKEVHAAFVQVDAGQAIQSAGFAEDFARIPVDKFLAAA